MKLVSGALSRNWSAAPVSHVGLSPASGSFKATSESRQKFFVDMIMDWMACTMELTA